MMQTRRAGRTVSDEVVGWLSFATMFIVGTDTFLVAPLLPELREQFGVATRVSGWLVSAYALGYALCALVAGPISDRMDRRWMLLVGMAGFTVLTAACGLAWGFWSMAAFRFLTGVAAALATPQIWASIPQLVPADRIVRTMGRATAGLAIAQLAGIPLGAFLAAVSWRFSFFAIGGVAAIVLVLLASIMLAGGFVFPVMMATLQAGAGQARGTVSSLSNVAMYAGTTVGVAIAGPIFAATSGFTGVAILAITAYLIALLLFTTARASRPV